MDLRWRPPASPPERDDSAGEETTLAGTHDTCGVDAYRAAFAPMIARPGGEQRSGQAAPGAWPRQTDREEPARALRWEDAP